MEEMTAEEKLQLYEAITAYSIGHEVVVDGSIKFIRSRIKAEIEKDRAAYEKVCQRNKKTAEKRRQKKKTTKSTSGINGMQSLPQVPVDTTSTKNTKNAERDNHNHIDYDNNTYLLSNNTNNKNSITKKIKEKEKEKNGFEEFWGVYPNKQKKIKAKEKYDALLKNGTVSHAVLMEGVMKYVAHIRKNNIEPKFIKQPTTRLNNWCWEDEYKITLARPPVVSKSPPPQPAAPVVSALTPTNETDKEKAKKVLSQWRANIKTL